ncbi:hypothetical protein Ddc_15495 [Ditylenchus destructor]|nr:hypothetical protein Ddc_15495 [Ditylenchus destructor]
MPVLICPNALLPDFTSKAKSIDFNSESVSLGLVSFYASKIILVAPSHSRAAWTQHLRNGLKPIFPPNSFLFIFRYLSSVNQSEWTKRSERPFGSYLSAFCRLVINIDLSVIFRQNI